MVHSVQANSAVTTTVGQPVNSSGSSTWVGDLVSAPHAVFTLGVVIGLAILAAPRTAMVIKAWRGDDKGLEEQTNNALENPPVIEAQHCPLPHVNGAPPTGCPAKLMGGAYIHNEMQLLDLMLDGMQDAGLFMDTKGVIRCWNRAAEDLIGWTYNEIVGLNASILMCGSHAKHHQHYVDTYMAGRADETVARVVGKTRPIEVKHKDGRMLRCNIRVTHLNNGVTGFIGTIRPVNEVYSDDSVAVIIKRVDNK